MIVMLRTSVLFALAHAVRFAPEGDTGGGGGNAPATAPATEPALDPVKLSQALAATQAELKAIKAAQAKDAADRKAAEERALGEQGQFKTLAEQKAAEAEELRKRLAELEPDATVGRTYREQKQAEIDAAAKTLAASDREILDSLSTIDAKVKFLARISSAPPTTAATAAAKPATGAGGPPPGSATVVISELIASKGIDYVKRNHPNEWDAYTRSLDTSARTRRGGLFST